MQTAVMENGVVQFIGYHCTSENNADNIIKNSFIINNITDFPENKGKDKFFTYWLGSGVYFYEDLEVAKWYSTGNHGKYGTDNKNSSQTILQSQIDCTAYIDLRKVLDWRKITDDFDFFFEQVGKSFVVNLKNGDEKSDKDKFNKAIHQMRCLFFNWYHTYRNIKMIIAAFNLGEYEYIEKGTYSAKEYFGISYTEVQYCIYDTSIIKQTTRYKEEG